MRIRVSTISDNELERGVRTEARLTHAQPLAADAAAAANLVARSLAQGRSWRQALTDTERVVPGEIGSVVVGWESTPSDRSGFAPAVLHASVHFVGTSTSPREALNRSMSFSGETNYVPVLAGALAGARWGWRD